MRAVLKRGGERGARGGGEAAGQAGTKFCSSALECGACTAMLTSP